MVKATSACDTIFANKPQELAFRQGFALTASHIFHRRTDSGGGGLVASGGSSVLSGGGIHCQWKRA
jgi:hypothetical protein